jgi:hypothetical protein
MGRQHFCAQSKPKRKMSTRPTAKAFEGQLATQRRDPTRSVEDILLVWELTIAEHLPDAAPKPAMRPSLTIEGCELGCRSRSRSQAPLPAGCYQNGPMPPS